jgi:hypothetical protein
LPGFHNADVAEPVGFGQGQSPTKA